MRISAILPCLPVGLALLGCAAGTDSTWLHIEGPGLEVEASIEGCSEAQARSLTAAANLAQSQLARGGRELLACLTEYSLTATGGDSPELILQRLRVGSVQLRCEALGSSAIKAAALVEQEDRAVVRFNTAYLEEGPHVLGLAATLLHELTHARGYRHGAGSPEWADDPRAPTRTRTSTWHDLSVSQQVARCSAAMAAGQYRVAIGALGDYADADPNVPRGNFAARSDHVRAAWLAPLGARSESAGRGEGWDEEIACGGGTFSRGFAWWGNEGLAGLTMPCASRDGAASERSSAAIQPATGVEPVDETPAIDEEPSGTLDASPRLRTCPRGTLVVGAAARESAGIAGLEPACQSASALRRGELAGRELAAGADPLGATYRWCPPRMAVRRLLVSRREAGRAGPAGGLRIECAALDEGESPRTALSGREEERADLRVFRELCATGSVLRVFEGRASSRVERLEGTCAELEVTGSGALRYSPEGAATAALEGHGGYGGRYSVESADPSCPSGQALVGVEVSMDRRRAPGSDATGSVVVGLNGLCAPLAAWWQSDSGHAAAEEAGATERATAQAGAEAELTLSPMGWMGQQTRDTRRQLCPQGLFVGGWDVGAGATPGTAEEPWVQTLALHCVDPG